jgi:oxygen-independent coproporphyrinogen-3 oxidase
MMMGLRLVDEGVSRRKFLTRFGRPLEDYFDRDIQALQHRGLLEDDGIDGDCLRLTRHGRLLGNQVFMQFVGGKEPEFQQG